MVNDTLRFRHWPKLEIAEFGEKTIFLWTLPNRFRSTKSVWRCRLRQCRIAFDRVWIQSYIGPKGPPLPCGCNLVAQDTITLNFKTTYSWLIPATFWKNED